MFPGKMLYIWSMSRLWWLWRKNVNDGLVTLTYLHGKVRNFCSHMTINKAQLANCHMQHVLKKVRPSSRSTHFTHPFYDKKAAFPLQTSGSSIGAQQNPATVNEQQDHHRVDLGGFPHPISQDKISTAPSCKLHCPLATELQCQWRQLFSLTSTLLWVSSTNPETFLSFMML